MQGDKERCDMGPFGFAEDQSCCCILNYLYFCLSEGTEGEEGRFSSRCGWFEFLHVWSIVKIGKNALYG